MPHTLVSNPPNDDDIIEVAERLCVTLEDDTQWEKFGMRLLKTKDKAQLTRINRQCEGHKSAFLEKCKALLQKWLKTASDEPKWQQVIETLKEVKLHGLARELEKALIPDQPNITTTESTVATNSRRYNYQHENSGEKLVTYSSYIW